jgi:UPF0716 protein FxsA
MIPAPVLFLLFLAIPVLEIYCLILVGRWIGALPTVLLVILTAAVGATLARHQGLATLQRLQATLARGELPAIELFEGVILLVGAFLLLIPGFITDLAGLVCLFPAARRVLALWAMRHIKTGPPPPAGPAGSTSSREGRTLEGEFHREDD